MKRIILIICLTICFNSIINAEISKKMFLNEVKEVIKKGEEIHANFYHNIAKEDLNKYIEETILELSENISEKKAISILASILSKIGDAHTFALIEGKKVIEKDMKILPFKFYIIKDKIYLLDSIDEMTKGSLILKINNQSVEEIIKNISKHISYETDTFKEWILNNEFFKYYYLLYDYKENYEIVYKDKKDNIIKKKIVNGISIEKYKKNFLKRRKKYDFEIYSSKIGIIKINTFADDQDYSIFLEKTFSRLKKEKIENLIIDVRNNNGGNSTLAELLGRYISNKKIKMYSYIDTKVSEESKKNHLNWKKLLDSENGELIREYSDETYPLNRYKGNIYIIANGGTFSSASNFVAMIKDYNLGILVGEESGSLYSSYGDPYCYETIYTKTKIFISSKYLSNASEKTMKKGVMPNIIVKPKIDDIINNIDTQLEYIINQLIYQRD